MSYKKALAAIEDIRKQLREGYWPTEAWGQPSELVGALCKACSQGGRDYSMWCERLMCGQTRAHWLARIDGDMGKEALVALDAFLLLAASHICCTRQWLPEVGTPIVEWRQNTLSEALCGLLTRPKG